MKPSLSGRFIMRPWELYTSHSYRALNLYERRCLDRLELEHLKKAGKENGKLTVTYVDMRREGVGWKYAAASFRVLEALGLIQRTQQGRAANGEFRLSNLWRITYLPTAPSKKDQTHDWMKIQSADEAEAIAQANRYRDQRNRRPPPRPPRPKRKLRAIAATAAAPASGPRAS
jgi:hypothetical protein